MPSSQQAHARINLGELKSQISMKLGAERARSYFSCLNSFLSQKLSKSEFDKLCASTLGQENIHLHNQLILSILRNAFYTKSPPSLAWEKFTSKPSVSLAKNSCEKDDGFTPFPVPTPPPPVWSNGSVLLPSPRNVRSSIRDQRNKDRPSALGPNVRADLVATQVSGANYGVDVRENGTLCPCDSKRPVQQHQDGLMERPVKRQQIENLVPDKRVVEAGTEEVRAEQNNHLKFIGSPLQAPLGIPFCPASIGGAQRSLRSPTSSSIGDFSSYDNGELCHTEALRIQMEKIAEAHGLGGAAMDCANLLNNGLDVYLKRLIESCIELVGTRLRRNAIKHPLLKQQSHGKSINGVWTGNHIHLQSSPSPLNAMNGSNNHLPVSLQDLKVAIELNPQKLGEDWPLLLEKICLSSLAE